MVNEELGRRIRAARDRSGMSQAALALAVGAGHQSTVAGWERGRTEPDAATIGRLATALNVSTDYLLGIHDEPHASREHLDKLALDIAELSPADRAVVEKIVAALKPGDNAKVIPS